MKYNTYQDYIEAARKHFEDKKDLKVPVEYMLLSEEMFNLFNGTINFGPKQNCCNCDGNDCCSKN